MNQLMIGQALLFGLIIIFFGIIIVNEKIPSLKYKNEEKDINFNYICCNCFYIIKYLYDI